MRVTEMKVTNKRAADRKRCWKMVIAVLFATAAVSMSALAGQWRQDDTGWWYQNENGTYLKSEWSWIDGKCYYFNEDGYCLQSHRMDTALTHRGHGLRAAWYRLRNRARTAAQ